MESKISIVLPVFNGQDIVGRAIESVLSQTYRDLELIIVNDCSQDDTLSVISEYAAKDARIRIINNEINKKLPASLNVGFAEASGEYWTWTSDDNTYHPDALEKMAAVLDNDEEIDLVYADFSVVDMEGNLIEEMAEGDPSEIRFRNNIGACFLYRRSLAEAVGIYDTSAFLAEDYDFFIRCYEKGRFYHIEEDLYDYGRHDKSLSLTRRNDITRQTIRIMEKHFDFLYSQCLTRKEKNRFLNETLYHYWLLSNKEDAVAARNRFYARDRVFAVSDTVLRIIRKISYKARSWMSPKNNDKQN